MTTTKQSKRPYVQVRAYVWRDADGTPTPGISLRNGQRLAAHLTPTEAIAMANKLVDLTEQVERTPARHVREGSRHSRESLPLVDASGSPEEPLPTTDLYNE